MGCFVSSTSEETKTCNSARSPNSFVSSQNYSNSSRRQLQTINTARCLKLRRMSHAKTYSLRAPQGLTPYQGTHRCWGEFECECGNTWSSGNSWRDTYQKCNDCDDKIYPCTQRKLRRNDHTDGPAHEQAKCQKCKEIGFNCRQLRHDRQQEDDDDECDKGYFNCECGRSWTSRNYSVNEPQECRDCGEYVECEDDDDDDDDDDYDDYDTGSDYY